MQIFLSVNGHEFVDHRFGHEWVRTRSQQMPTVVLDLQTPSFILVPLL